MAKFFSKPDPASISNILKDGIAFFHRIDEIISASTNVDGVSANHVILRCECFKKNKTAKIMYGCTDGHFIDMTTISYFTLGVYSPFFYISLLILTLAKLCRSCGCVNDILYSKTPVLLRKKQTLLNILGDIFAFVVGHFFSMAFSWPIILLLILCLNLLASREGGDILSMVCWYIDSLGYTERRKRYVSESPLEKWMKKD